jgi:RNA polymerase sigma-70 factor (ECF subfamily)
MTERINESGLDQPSDATLLGKLQDGDHRAFAALYHRYKQQLYGFCVRMLGDRDSAKDVLQASFLKLFERSGQIQDPERFRSWLFSVVRNDCLSAMRRQGTADEAVRTLASEQSSAPIDSAKGDNHNDLRARVAAAVQGLPTDYRDVVILREYHDLSYKEIAEVTNTSEGTVRFRLFTARRKLHEMLTPKQSRIPQ